MATSKSVDSVSLVGYSLDGSPTSKDNIIFLKEKWIPTTDPTTKLSCSTGILDGGHIPVIQCAKFFKKTKHTGVFIFP